MQPAMVITRSGGSTRFARSDELAARVMQGVVKDARADDPTPPANKPTARNQLRAPRTKRGAEALRHDVALITSLLEQLHGFADTCAADQAILVRADVIEHGLFAAEILQQRDVEDPSADARSPSPAEDISNPEPCHIAIGPAQLDLIQVEPGIAISQSAQSHFSVLLLALARADLRLQRTGEDDADLDLMVGDLRLMTFARFDYTASLKIYFSDAQIVLNTDAPLAKACVMDVAV